MKKIISLFFILISATIYSQAITINSTNYSVPQLVNSVLINSPCDITSNITWRTGTNFGSSNGIGYFENTNPNFPMQSGVILSTGNIINAPGPNNSFQSNGSAGWPGDSDLESVLAQSGINMNSTNATVLEFDFTPVSSHFDFDFLFASEEYGNFQCLFSDAFAFLLTNLNTGVTTNLAVVPGTNDPISVVTIREFLYNSNCDSQNAQFFGTFNGGSNAAGSATNFEGQTVVMNASAVLTPNTPYHIKLVIADRDNFEYDSAIFLSSNSFNIGQDVLGEDLTIAANTAPCAGSNYLLESGLNAANYFFTWSNNGQTIQGENNPNLIVTTAGTYQLTYTSIANPCLVISDAIVIEFQNELSTPNPINLYKCDTGALTYTYNLAQNTPIVTQGMPAGTTVSYHATVANAEANIGNLPLNYNTTPNQTIYVRINHSSGDCYVVKPFDLLLTNPATATQPNEFFECSNQSLSNTATFNLATLNSVILNGQSSSIYQVNYFSNLTDANAGTNPFNAFNYNSTSTTIYASVSLITDTTCRSVTPVQLTVIVRPEVDELQQVITCDSYTLEPLTNGNYFTGSGGTGTPLFAGDIITATQTIYIYSATSTIPICDAESNFRIIIINPDDLEIESGNYCNGYSLPSLDYGAYFTQTGGLGNEIPQGTVITQSQVIHFYIYISPTCFIEEAFQINITIPQQVPQLDNVFDCTSYTLQPLSFGNYYTDLPTNGGTIIPTGTALTQSQTVYVYGETNDCPDFSTFEVVIGINFPTDVTECVSYTLPNLIVGGYFTQPMGQGTQIPEGTVIETTQTIYVYAVTQNLPNCTDNYNFTVTIELPVITVPTITPECYFITLPNIPVGDYYTEPNGGGTMLNAGDQVTESKTIYIYLNDGNGCENEKPLDITVFPAPLIDSRGDVDNCNSYTLTPLANGNYFTEQNGGGTQLNAGDEITTSQTIYIYATNANGCFVQNSFSIIIFPYLSQVVLDVTECDSYTLPALEPENHYYTDSFGPNGTGSEIPVGTQITATQTIYVYRESATRANCFDENTFTVTIIPTPFIGTVNPVNTCNSYILPTLTVGNYFTDQNGQGTMLNAGDEISTSRTIYIYAESGTSPVNCTDEKVLPITIYNVDELQNVTECESYTLPNLTTGNYYNGTGGTGGIIAQGNAINSSQRVYIYGNPGFNPSCSDETFFDVTIIPRPIVNPVPASLTTVCDEDGTNDGITTFDLSTLNTTILGNQTGLEFLVTYFPSFDDANNDTNAITSTTLSTIYAKVTNSLTPNCFDIQPITITVNQIPEPTPQNGIICIDNVTGAVLSSYVIESGLSSATHTFQWFDGLGNPVGTGNNYEAFLPDTYSVIATNIASNCASEEIFVEVNTSQLAIVGYTISDDFSNSQTITIQATGNGGDYEYQLDGGVFQDSPVFTVLSSGVHTITVRDKNGCGIISLEALIVNYPKYFTPNGDGFHDTWNIVDLKNNERSLISIFDRFGKLLKQISPDGNGWDGRYNGNFMVSDDYWFTVSYIKNNEPKEFKAHFTLKR